MQSLLGRREVCTTLFHTCLDSGSGIRYVKNEGWFVMCFHRALMAPGQAI